MTAAVTDRPARARRRWRFPTLHAVAALAIIIGTGLFLYPEAASWFSQRDQSRATMANQAQIEQPPNDDQIFRQQQLQRAHDYNRALASGAVLEANERIPTGDGTSSDDSLIYEDLLNATRTGFMGRLRYDALTIDLPIYHGTSDEVLFKGVGHLEGTSLPVGGVGTRSVLTAHRGLPSATLFNDLDDAKVGDTFTVSTIGHVVTYRVVETQVVEPNETEAILADPDRDLLTLVTCTPLGVNSHRILVNAERITPTPVEEIQAAAAPPEIPGFPWWAVIAGAVLIVNLVYVWRSGYPRKVASRREVA